MFTWWRSRRDWTPAAARRSILSGRPPRTMRVDGALNLAGEIGLRFLPERLTASTINITRCRSLRTLPAGLECWELVARECGLEHLPAGMSVRERIDAEQCRRLRSVGAYQLRQFVLRGCTALEELPEGLQVETLSLGGCPLWSRLPKSVLKSASMLDLSDCPQITELPDNFARLAGLNVSGCHNLTELPAGIRVRTWIDVADSGLRTLPYSLRSVQIVWHGVPVSDRVAFDPESIDAAEVLRERNQELRRVLLERMGLERFFAEARPVVLDEDRDAGGRRRLLHIETGDDEPIACVEVQCPSTGNRYLLRVPPTMLTCHEAIAWTAGYSNPRDYRPAMET